MLRLLRHYFYFVPAQLSKAKGIGKNILLKLQLMNPLMIFIKIIKLR